jgi:hypothetical protein
LVGPRPPKAGGETIVKSTVKGYLRIYTPETPVYDNEGFVGWDNGDYRIVPESGTGARTWFDRSPLALSPGTSWRQYDEKVRVSIKPGRITEVWLNDSDRPKFTSPTTRALVRDVNGDIIGYRNN